MSVDRMRSVISMLTDILSRTVLKLSQIVGYIMDTLRFRARFGGGLRVNVHYLS